MNFYGPESTSNHTLAGRLIPLCEALYRAIMRASHRPDRELKYSAALPPWCHRICDEFTKTIFRGLVSAAPPKGAFHARNYGRIVGVLLRLAGFWLKDAPAQLQRDGLLNLTPEEDQKIEKLAGIEQVFPVASEQLQKPITNEQELADAMREHAERKTADLMGQALAALQYLATQPAGEQHQFLCGIPEGFVSVINPSGEFAGKRGRYEIYLILLMCWPEIVEMQRAQPPKTRRDLLEWLEKREDRQLFEDSKTFYELCDDIDLNLAPPGHPRKSAPV